MDRREFSTLLASIPLLSFAKWSEASHTPSPLKGYIRTNWSQDPFSYGAYSYLAKGSGNADREKLLEPINNRIFFAGEALNPNYQSSVHAAYESGLSASEHIQQTKSRRIAIIGAGISGIGAAKQLADKGYDITIFEGRDRIGGRIQTNRSLGVALDVGASWIHSPDGNPISELADQVNLKRIETDDTQVMRGNDGRSMWQFFAPNWIKDVIEQTPTGTELDNLNMKETVTQFLKHGYGYEGRDVKFPNGYDEIFKALQGNYQIKLSAIVTRISHNQTGVNISTVTEASQKFDAVIVTVPLGVLKRKTINFDPELPQSKLDAIARMGMGTLDKLYLKFEESFWDKGMTSIFTPETGLPRGQFNYWINFEKYLNEPIIMGFNAGEAALKLSNKSDDFIIKSALNTLSSAYPVNS